MHKFTKIAPTHTSWSYLFFYLLHVSERVVEAKRKVSATQAEATAV